MPSLIPKIMHQLWIGTKPAPTEFMDSWRDKHPDFEYIRWNEQEILKRGLKLSCQNRIDEMQEINGKADIIRWEILYEYGGVFLDADSICIEPIDETLMSCPCFAGWEQEQIRQGLIATGTMGFPPKHPLVKGAIEWMKANTVNVMITRQRAWQTVGPGLLTRMYNTGLHMDLTIFPSYSFLPIHCSGMEYKGHGKIYAYQEWGSTKQNYDIMNSIKLPSQFLPPTECVSVLVSSLNTKAVYLQQCLDSIKAQEGIFNVELVWINDGSDSLHTSILKKMLDKFEKTTRFVTVIYSENDGNKGLGYTLNRGVNMSSNEIIMRMDADDIMYPLRIKTQLEYMSVHKDCVLCGAQINMFEDIDGKMISTGVTTHANININSYKENLSHWIINHPTFCFRKSKILAVGNYNADIHSMYEDFELVLRVLKQYGSIDNIQEPLLYYRLHPGQVTHDNGSNDCAKYTNIRNNLITDIIINDYVTVCVKKVTIVITSCNRPNELKPTLLSLFKYNSYPVHKIIIIDDSGIDGCIDDCIQYIPDGIEHNIIYNENNIGQIASVDKAYSLVDTEYIFHCEDDWEFYDHGFIEKSLEILENNDKVFTVWLREYVNFSVTQNGHPVVPAIYNDTHRLMGVFKERTNVWSGFTFNPGLRRLKDYRLFSPYAKYVGSPECNCGGVEQALSSMYYKNGFLSAITLNDKGYIRHIGWDNPTDR